MCIEIGVFERENVFKPIIAHFRAWLKCFSDLNLLGSLSFDHSCSKIIYKFKRFCFIFDNYTQRILFVAQNNRLVKFINGYVEKNLKHQINIGADDGISRRSTNSEVYFTWQKLVPRGFLGEKKVLNTEDESVQQVYDHFWPNKKILHIWKKSRNNSTFVSEIFRVIHSTIICTFCYCF